MRFTPTEDFWCEELKSQYVKGLTYTVHYPTSRLAGYAKNWLAEGKVTEVIGSSAVIAGSDKPASFIKRIFQWL